MIVYTLTRAELSTILQFDPDLLSWIPDGEWNRQPEEYWMVREHTFVQLSHSFVIDREYFPPNVSFMLGRIRYSLDNGPESEMVELRVYMLFWTEPDEEGFSPLPDYGGSKPYNPNSN